ncbi:MAG TPA: HAD family phosphatase [Lacipirellulaceae bacterium]|nr:HAD family phosphatase [Lacipirellulaceae bacterium]
MTGTGSIQGKIALRAVIFDLDGLIANTEDLYEQAGETVLRRRGKTYDAELREKIMGRPVVDALRIMIDCHSLPDSIEDLMCECGEELQKLIATSLAPMPGVAELIRKLHDAHLPIAVATSGTLEYADHVLSRLNLTVYFRFVLTAEDIHRGKPAPDIYLLAAERLGLAPSELMVLEDSANGCRAGVAAGAFAIAVPNRHTSHHKFDGARLVANTLADPRILQALHLA